MKLIKKNLKIRKKTFHGKHFIGNTVKASGDLLKDTSRSNNNKIFEASKEEIDEVTKLSYKAFKEYKKIKNVVPFLECISKNIKKKEKEIIEQGI
jgi:hypothetical protein